MSVRWVESLEDFLEYSTFKVSEWKGKAMPLHAKAQLSAQADKLRYASWCNSENAHGMGLFKIASSAKDFWGSLCSRDLGEWFVRKCLLPVVGQQFFEIAVGICCQSLNDVCQICPWFDAMTPAS